MAKASRRTQSRINSGFSAGSLTNLAAIPIATAVFTMVGFYYITNSTLQRHTEDITAVKNELKTATIDDNAQRAKIREEFLAAQTKTYEGIGKLDTRLAVAETQQKAANDTLTKIADEIARLTVLPPVATPLGRVGR